MNLKKRTITRLAKQKLQHAIGGRLQSCADLDELADEYPSLREDELEAVQNEIWKQTNRLSKFLGK